MQTTAKVHHKWVDIAKGIAIISIVLRHNGYAFHHSRLLPVEDLLGTLWAVSVFFLISGFFIKDEKLTRPVPFIKHKVRTLYRLTVYLYVPAVLLHNVFLRIGFYDTVTVYGGKVMTMWDGWEMAKNVVLALLFAGREPVMGAMWFAYVLFLALCGYSLLSWAIRRIARSRRAYELGVPLALLAISIASCTATQLLGITIPRGSNTLTAMWLLWCGQTIYGRMGCRFDNGYVCAASALVVWHTATIFGGVAMNANAYPSIITLTVGSAAALYVVCYVSRLVEKGFVGDFLALCGKDSFYIMGLHFIGFRVATLVLSLFGMERNLASEKAPSEGALWLLIYYTAFGVLFSIAAIESFRAAKRGLVKAFGQKR